MAKLRMIGTCMPVSTMYSPPAISATTAAICLVGQRNAVCSHSTSTSLVAPKASPMTMPICSPATASRCASPEARNASRSASGMADGTPVSSVAADCPRRARQNRLVAAGDRLPQRLQPAGEAGYRVPGDQLRRPEGEPVRRQAAVEGVPLQVPGAGIGRRRRRLHQGTDADAVARLDRGRGPGCAAAPG